MTALELLSRGPGRAALSRHLPRQGAIAAGPALFVVLGAALMPAGWLDLDAGAIGLPPGISHPFGTDGLGRDVAARTLAALSLSVKIGLAASLASTCVALAMALAASLSVAADRTVGAITELMLGLPHFVLLIMVAFAFGGGTSGVVIAVALTHWPRLARLLRHEAQVIAASEYVAVSRSLGRSGTWVARHHLAPHLLPQLVAGCVLTFPHAILHEAGLSFIGLGIAPHLPSIGVMLADSLGEILAGRWWVAAAPGLALIVVALSFERFGEALRAAAAPPGPAS